MLIYIEIFIGTLPGSLSKVLTTVPTMIQAAKMKTKPKNTFWMILLALLFLSEMPVVIYKNPAQAMTPVATGTEIITIHFKMLFISIMKSS